MANRFPLTVNSSTKIIEELSSGDNLNLSGSGIYDGTTLGNTGDFLRKKSGGGVEWSNVAPGSTPIPVASETMIGGIKVGQNLSIDSNGVLSSNLDGYALPIASSTQLGGIKIGAGLTINPISGVVTAQSYSLPIASNSTLGGIKIGTGLSIAGDGTVSVSAPVTIATSNVPGIIKIGTGLSVAVDGTTTLNTASSTVLGGIKVGSGLSIDSQTGVLSNAYTLPTASTLTLGGVKIDGTSIVIANGVISASVSGIGLSSRTTTSYTTATLSAGASDNSATFVGFKSYAILNISTSAAAWVTLYTDATSRSVDSSRPDSIDPLPGSGVLAEVITTGAQTVTLTPGTFGFNSESPVGTTIYAKITNKGGSSTPITVTLTILKLEV